MSNMRHSVFPARNSEKKEGERRGDNRDKHISPGGGGKWEADWAKTTTTVEMCLQRGRAIKYKKDER